MNIKKLIVNILIPLTAGIIGSLIGNISEGFNSMIKAPLTPPQIVFPIVWTILYILMGISAYLINKEDKTKETQSALKIYLLQLFFNMLWTFFFFNLNWYLFAFIWLLIMIVLVIIMIYKFHKINKTAAYLQIPYLIWLLFASYLNLAVYLLN